MVEKYSESKEGAPFNMALASLERLNELLKKIEMVSTIWFDTKGNPISLKYKQVTKYNFVKQFFIQAVPLLNKTNKETIKIDLDKIKFDSDYETGGATYTPIVDFQLDDLMIKMQELLQEEGHYFMPSNKDPRFGWKQ